MPIPQSNPVVLYDGVCGLCNRLNQFLLKRDTHDRFRFASLQSDLAETLLKRHGVDSHDLDTVFVVLEYGRPGEQLLSESDAIIHALTQLDGVWKWAGVGRLLPKFLRDRMYRLVARNRYRIFGKHESCMLPDPKHRHKFLEV